ncbi:type II 3-dehydroquinate dehydratase [Candidatus Odyssella acanthamoebae]|uniref:3-dehydroquinate dehydratase n=1 Tax=Candidatus Odyssella acanthamoebae TaxID=91604 RepID=A0A077AWU8_9PROT|nr:type II 3-dehydroquinate dehydratase [Candidatus Paracaedibacter acanthamoebae]AIK96986.1 3-dehydroquinate dehydratase [Candidatus Paracaedibacter acanthamoebae]
MHKIWVINGPNLNLLGQRNLDHYEGQTFDELTQLLHTKAKEMDLIVECRQSNHEGDLVDWIQAAKSQVEGIIINAGGLTHTSVSIHDALEILECPKIEVHISNIYAREEFRRKSLVSPVVNGMIAGFGQKGYILALEHIKTLIKANN